MCVRQPSTLASCSNLPKTSVSELLTPEQPVQRAFMTQENASLDRDIIALEQKGRRMHHLSIHKRSYNTHPNNLIKFETGLPNDSLFLGNTDRATSLQIYGRFYSSTQPLQSFVPPNFSHLCFFVFP